MIDRSGADMTWHGSRVPKSPCPHCGKINDAATDPVGNAVPKPGNVGVCLTCSGIAIYDQRRRLRKPTAGELTEIAQSPEGAALIDKVQRAIRALPT